MVDVASDDEAAIVAYAAELIAAIEVALGPWVMAAVAHRHPRPLPPEVEEAAAIAAEEAVVDVGRRVKELLLLDIDDQWTNPLAIVRTATAYPTAILAEAGVPPVPRDASDIRINPDDLYALAPATFGDLGDGVHEPGLVWGAAKAHLHLSRRRQEAKK